MPIFADDHLDTAPGSAGPRTGFFEGIEAGFNQAFVVDSQTSLQQEIINRWKENLELLRKQQNVAYDLPSPERITQLIRARNGEDLFDPNNADSYIQRGAIIEFPARYRAALEESLGDLSGQDEAFRAAGLPTFEDIFEEVQALQREVEATSSAVTERGGAAGLAGQIIGGIGGSFTLRDPLLLATLPVGGAGKTVATRLFTEAVAAGASEAVLQYGAIADNRELAGLPEGDKLQNVLLAAGGAAVLGGLLEGGVAAFRRAGRSADAAQPEVSLDFEDAQLRQFLGERPGDPRARAALDLLDEDATLAAASPYGTSYQGLRRFSAEVAEAELALLGQTSTAIGRALPQDIPLSIREREADFTIVRETSPTVAARYDAAEARLATIDAGIEEVSAEVQARTVLDAVRLVDEDAAEQLTQLAARTDIPEEAKALEADLIFNRVGKERILRAAEDAEIAPRKQTQTLRASRKAASREYRNALKAMEVERVKLNTAADRVKALLTGETKDLLGYAVATRPIQGSALSRERVTAQRSLILEGAEAVVDNAQVPVLREDGMIEIGDTAIPANFRIFNEAGEPVEISRLLRDLDEDDRLAEAMKVCSI